MSAMPAWGRMESATNRRAGHRVPRVVDRTPAGRAGPVGRSRATCNDGCSGHAGPWRSPRCTSSAVCSNRSTAPASSETPLRTWSLRRLPSGPMFHVEHAATRRSPLITGASLSSPHRTPVMRTMPPSRAGRADSGPLALLATIADAAYRGGSSKTAIDCRDAWFHGRDHHGCVPVARRPIAGCRAKGAPTNARQSAARAITCRL